jgi:recombination associated protein RdgC
VNPLDVIKEQADATLHDEDERFDADFALMAGELASLLTDLTDALGGERKAEGTEAPSTSARRPDPTCAIAPARDSIERQRRA